MMLYNLVCVLWVVMVWVVMVWVVMMWVVMMGVIMGIRGHTHYGHIT